MIPKMNFGRTGHASIRIIFGGCALSQATQAEADRVLGDPQVFLITSGDMALLPKVLEAASRAEGRPGEEEMQRLVKEFGIRAVFV